MVKTSVFQPKQAEFNLAILNGEEVSLPSDDLYIPPNALKIFLESFEGPLDLLLYFIKKQNLNILEIDVSNSIVNVTEDTFVGGSSEAGVGYTTTSSY